MIMMRDLYRWVIKAMTYYVRDVCQGTGTVEALAPNEVRRLLVKVLSLDEWAQQERYSLPNSSHFVHFSNYCFYLFTGATGNMCTIILFIYCD